MKELIRMDCDDDYLINSLWIDIDLGNICNFVCSYCYLQKELGEMWIDYDKLTTFLDKHIISDKTVVILSGGEAVIYPKITELLQFLKSKKAFVAFISNGTNELKWWKENLQYIDKLTLSYHIEFTDYDDFVSKIELVNDKKRVQVNLAMIPKRFDECMKIADKLKEYPNVFIAPKILINTETKVKLDYNKEQLIILSSIIKPKTTTLPDEDIKTYGVKFIYSDGSE